MRDRSPRTRRRARGKARTGKSRAARSAPRKAPPAQPSRAGGEGSAPAVTPAPFPIVGIGASAGGLEALELFLRNVPAESGMAFVVVQHLDPSHKGILVELLQRRCTIPVVQVKDRTRVEPDRVYVIPPNRDLSLLHGVLHLLRHTTPRILPIDFFLRSLAEDRQEQSIGVVLSGMGSDGTLGLAAIKEKGGATFVQSLSSAKFAGMPGSAIDSGHADVVAAAEELPGRILGYHRHRGTRSDLQPEARQQGALEKVFVLLRAHTGNDFSLYKRSTIHRRIERRMGLHQIDKLAAYVRLLRENPEEAGLLFKELLIGVTSFFRDPAAWSRLRDHLLPELLDARARREGAPRLGAGVLHRRGGVLAGHRAQGGGRAARKWRSPPAVQIFATDLDAVAIERARLGSYPPNIAADVTPERLRRFFVQSERGYHVSREIRETVVFAPQNLVADPPFTRLDVLSCRNLLIYLSPELQRKLIPLFHYSLNPGGVLFLGTAETVGSFTGLFTAVDGKARLYRRADAPTAVSIEFPSSFAALPPPAPGGARGQADPPRPWPANLQTVADRLIMQRFAPAAILTNDKGEIRYISGRTGKYLEPAVGRANLNVFAMAREGLRSELSAAFSAALAESRPVTVHGIRIGTNGGSQTVDLTIEKLTEPRDLRGDVIIIVADVPAGAPDGMERPHRPAATPRVAERERELRHARDELQTTRQEMQTSQEELTSTNEELQSTNEELQSSNEELTTSKEEMQSMNEELHTVNQELQSKVDELSRSSNDMKNLLNSTEIATLFLDGRLLVRRFTPPTSRLIKLIPGDTGRPITDIATELDYPGLADDAREVLRTLLFKERQVWTRDGRWFNVRILPYRTIQNVIDGVVITFTDWTPTKVLESTLREQASELRQMAESLPNLVWGCQPDGSCDYFSRQWVDYTGNPEKEQLGYGWLEHVHPEDRERVRDEWRGAVESAKAFDAEFRIRGHDGRYRWFKTRSTPIRRAGGAVVKWYATSTDVDELKRAADARQEAASTFAAIVDAMSQPFLAVDVARRVTAFNAAAEQELARSREDALGKPLAEILPSVAEPEADAHIEAAIRDQQAISFELEVDHRRLGARLLGHPGGAVLLLQRSGEPSRAGEPGTHPPARIGA